MSRARPPPPRGCADGPGRRGPDARRARASRSVPSFKPGRPRRGAIGRAGAGGEGVRVIEVLLSRSCFGTENVWSKLGGIVALNLTMLRLVVRRMRAAGDGFSLGRFPEISADELARIIRQAGPRFVEREAPLGAAMFRIPLLEFDRPDVWRARHQTWATE